MNSEKGNIAKYVYLREIVGAAAMDMHSDLAVVERSFYHWAARALHKLTNETFKTGKRYAIIPVNKSFNSATLDCDFIEALFVGEINSYGEKVPFHLNTKLINSEFVETIEDEGACQAKCTGCFSKAACNDLQTTEVLRSIDINGTEYDETKTSTLEPDGTYFVITETPFYNTTNMVVEYKTKKEYITTLDLEPCGCIKATVDNSSKLKTANYDCYCTYCSPVCRERKEVGYKIFPETSTIKFDHNFTGDRFYMEWRGTVPKKNGEYIAPAIAKETLIHLTKFLSIQNKKGVALSEREWVFDQYRRERNNMDMVRGQMSLHDILYSLSKTPDLSYT